MMKRSDLSIQCWTLDVRCSFKISIPSANALACPITAFALTIHCDFKILGYAIYKTNQQDQVYLPGSQT